MASVPSEQLSDGQQGSVLFARFMLPDGSEFPCQISDVSPDGALFMSDAPVAPGTAIVAYLDGLGRVEASVGRILPKGFHALFSLTGARRDRFVARLNAMASGVDPLRRHERYAPREQASQIALADGRVYPCEIIDISLSGASVRLAVLPRIGTVVTLGKMRGHVVRHHDHGVGISFVQMLDRETLADATR
ncbi:MAG: PilZ domain-containing protein [Hyphomicrobiales bacterium]